VVVDIGSFTGVLAGLAVCVADIEERAFASSRGAAVKRLRV
jgi:hypothetical protein